MNKINDSILQVGLMRNAGSVRFDTLGIPCYISISFVNDNNAALRIFGMLTVD